MSGRTAHARRVPSPGGTTLALLILWIPALAWGAPAELGWADPPRPLDEEEDAAPRFSGLPASASKTGALTGPWDAAWSVLPPPEGGQGRIGIHDPIRDRMLMLIEFGLPARTVEVWALPLSGAPIWTAVGVAGPRPPARNYTSAIYDQTGDRILLFGGNTSGTDYLNDLWSLSLDGEPTWTLLTPTGAPPSGRYGHSAVYDPARDRMLVYGGREGATYHDDVWELSLGANPSWTELAPGGTPPPGRAFHSAIHDPVRDRMIAFAGGGASALNDAWELSLAGGTAWAPLLPMGPSPSSRSFHTAIYASEGDRMVVFAGLTGPPTNDVWELTLAGPPSWIPISPSGTLPPIRYDHTAIHDPVRQRMLAFGGVTQPSPDDNGVWGLSLVGSPAWSAITPGGGVPGRADHGAALDPMRDRLVVFGGITGWGTSYPIVTSSTWALSLAGIPSWTRWSPLGTPPSARHGHTALYDPVRDRVLVYGGRNYGQSFADTWALSLADSPSWTPAAPPSVERWGHTAIYDPARDRMIVFGGHYVHGNFLLRSLRALSLVGTQTWSTLTTSGASPSARHLHSAIYDPVGDRMILFGGKDPADRNDVWALSLSGTPGWSLITTAGAGPSPRSEHAAIYDALRQRMIVIGGRDSTGNLADVWALSLDHAPTWIPIAPAGQGPVARGAHSASVDAARDRVVLFGGWENQYDVYGDGFALELAGVVGVAAPSRPGTGSRILRVRPNPAHGPTTFDLELTPDARPVVLLVVDARGRRVGEVRLGPILAGRHAVVWDGRGPDGRRVPSGIYFARLGGSRTGPVTRFAVIR